jgi:cell division protein FtsL
MNSDVDKAGNEKATETVTEELVARKPRKRIKKFLFLVIAVILMVALGFIEVQKAIFRNASGPARFA